MKALQKNVHRTDDNVTTFLKYTSGKVLNDKLYKRTTWIRIRKTQKWGDSTKNKKIIFKKIPFQNAT